MHGSMGLPPRDKRRQISLFAPSAETFFPSSSRDRGANGFGHSDALASHQKFSLQYMRVDATFGFSLLERAMSTLDRSLAADVRTIRQGLSDWEYRTGGEGGIRTLGTGVSPYNGLANRRIRPLCHLSDCIISNFLTLPKIYCILAA